MQELDALKFQVASVCFAYRPFEKILWLQSQSRSTWLPPQLGRSPFEFPKFGPFFLRLNHISRQMSFRSIFLSEHTLSLSLFTFSHFKVLNAQFFADFDSLTFCKTQLFETDWRQQDWELLSRPSFPAIVFSIWSFILEWCHSRLSSDPIGVWFDSERTFLCCSRIFYLHTHTLTRHIVQSQRFVSIKGAVWRLCVCVWHGASQLRNCFDTSEVRLSLEAWKKLKPFDFLRLIGS